MGKTMYKFLNNKGKSIISTHGNLKWTIGEWQHVDGDIKACKNGLHASKSIYRAFSFVEGSVLAKVEVKGKHDDENDKSAYSDMRIIEAYKWTKKDTASLIIFASEMRLNEFEKLYPTDHKPRKAIDAAKAVLAHDTVKNRLEALSAVVFAADSEAWSAWLAAEAAAWSAANSAAIKKIDKWFKARVKELEKL